jgi:hypothetical protein
MQNASGLLLPLLDVLASNIIDVSGFSYAAATIIFKTHTHTLSHTHSHSQTHTTIIVKVMMAPSCLAYSSVMILQNQLNNWTCHCSLWCQTLSLFVSSSKSFFSWNNLFLFLFKLLFSIPH